MARVLILGGGFAGLVAAEELAASLSTSSEITLVAPNRMFTFYPALVHLAFGRCKASDIQFDLQGKLKELGVHFVQGEMTSVIAHRKSVEIAGEDFRGEISYDFVVFALGRQLATEKITGFFKNSHHLLGVNPTQRFGDAVRDFREGDILLGLCPGGRLPVPVCETAFSLAKTFENEISEGSVRVKVILPESLDAAFGGARIHQKLEAAFEKHRINVLYDIPISEISEEKIYSTNGHEIKYDLAMLVPPFCGHSSLAPLHITDDSDFIKTDDRMRVQGLENAYAVGDSVAFSGPKFAHMAVRQARVAAANLVSEVKGEEPQETYYHEIATIIDAGGADSIYLHYGIWDEELFRLKKGNVWTWAKDIHSALWRSQHA